MHQLGVHIYLWRKVVCFVLKLWGPPNLDASDCVLGVFRKLSMRSGAWASFHGFWTCGAKVLECWMISLLKVKLNRSWKFQMIWNVPLVLLERSWWARFDGDIDYLVISVDENSKIKNLIFCFNELLTKDPNSRLQCLLSYLIFLFFLYHAFIVSSIKTSTSKPFQ